MKKYGNLIYDENAVKEIRTTKSCRLPNGDSTVWLDIENSIIITLPKMVDSANCFVAIHLRSLVNVGTVLIRAMDMDFTVTLDSGGEYTLLYCNGMRWFEVNSNHA